MSVPPPHVFHTYCLAYLEKGVRAFSERSQAVPVHSYVCPPPPPCISHILSGISRERVAFSGCSGVRLCPPPHVFHTYCQAYLEKGVRAFSGCSGVRLFVLKDPSQLKLPPQPAFLMPNSADFCHYGFINNSSQAAEALA